MEKIYDDLIELYHNSGKEFFQEMVALLKHRFPLREHTVLIRGETGEWKLGASSLADCRLLVNNYTVDFTGL